VPLVRSFMNAHLDHRHRRAWARRGGARRPDLRCYRRYPRSAPTLPGGHGEPGNSAFCPETGSGQPFPIDASKRLDGIERCTEMGTACHVIRTRSRYISSLIYIVIYSVY
jgi:hypothetical protein